MAIKSARFNDLVEVAGSAKVFYGRGAGVTKDRNGAVLPASKPFFGRRHAMVAPPPAPVQLSATSASGSAVNQILACGKARNGTSNIAVQVKYNGSGSNYYLNIWVDATLTANGFDGTPTYQYNMGLATNSTVPDILKGSGDPAESSTSTVDGANWRHVPISAFVVHGLIIFSCQAYFNNAGSWECRSTAFVWWDEQNNKMVLLYREPTYNSGIGRLNTWTNQGAPFVTDNANPCLNVDAALVDYMTTNSGNTLSGIMWYVRASRRDSVAYWGVDPVQSVHRTAFVDTDSFGGAATHIHSATGQAYGTTGSRLIESRGHSTNSSMVSVLFPDRSSYVNPSLTSGGTPTRSTPNFGTVSTTPTTATPLFDTTAVNGATESHTGATLYLNALGDNSVKPPLESPQPMGLVAIPGTDGVDDSWTDFIATGDEGVEAAYKIKVPPFSGSSDLKLTCHKVNIGAESSQKFGWLAWGPRVNDHANPSTIVIQRLTGNSTSTVQNVATAGQIQNDTGSARFMISRDYGVTWGGFALPGERVTTKTFGIYGDYFIYDRTVATVHYLYYIPIPAVHNVNSLILSPSCEQGMALKTPLETGSAIGGATVTDVTSTYQNAGALSVGFTAPAAPFAGKVLRVQMPRRTAVSATITQAAGTATLTTSAAHGVNAGEYIFVQGADQAAYNGRQIVVATPLTTTLTFAVAGGTTSPATGTILMTPLASATRGQRLTLYNQLFGQDALKLKYGILFVPPSDPFVDNATDGYHNHSYQQFLLSLTSTLATGSNSTNNTSPLFSSQGWHTVAQEHDLAAGLNFGASALTKAITSIAQAGGGILGTSTVSCVGHGYVAGQLIDIDGFVTNTVYNGRHVVLSSLTADTFSIAVAGNPGTETIAATARAVGWFDINSFSQQTSPSGIDFLICFDSAVGGTYEKSRKSDWPTVPMPMNTTQNHTMYVPQDQCTIKVDPPTTTTWRWVGHLHVPFDAWDAYSRQASRPGTSTGTSMTRRLVTLADQDSKSFAAGEYVAVGVDTVNGLFTLTDGNTSITVSGVSGEVFRCDRDMDIHIAVSRSGTTYKLAVSVGGSQVNEASGTFASAAVKPDRVIHASPEWFIEPHGICASGIDPAPGGTNEDAIRSLGVYNVAGVVESGSLFIIE